MDNFLRLIIELCNERSNIAAPITPCGLCRQVIREFCTGDLIVIMVGSGLGSDHGLSGATAGTTVESRFEELLPLRLQLGPELA